MEHQLYRALDWLLERQTKESIQKVFDLTAISRRHPDFEETILRSSHASDA